MVPFPAIRYRPISPLFFAGSTPINSWFTQYGSRSINAVEALEYSSNTYMVQIASKMMGNPPPNMTYKWIKWILHEKLRSTFAEHGLGTSTGIDFPMNRPVLSRKSIQSVII